MVTTSPSLSKPVPCMQRNGYNPGTRMTHLRPEAWVADDDNPSISLSNLSPSSASNWRSMSITITPWNQPSGIIVTVSCLMW